MGFFFYFITACSFFSKKWKIKKWNYYPTFTQLGDNATDKKVKIAEFWYPQNESNNLFFTVPQFCLFNSWNISLFKSKFIIKASSCKFRVKLLSLTMIGVAYNLTHNIWQWKSDWHQRPWLVMRMTIMLVKRTTIVI